MSKASQKITPFLWYNGQAEEAAKLYTSVFRKSRVVQRMKYNDAGPGPKGELMLAVVRIEGQEFVLFNGGPHFTFSQAISLVVYCKTQAEIDRLWEKLSEGGEKQECGWVKDKFGVSWQIVPANLHELIGGKNQKRSARVMSALFQMRKLDIKELTRAYRQV